MVLILFAMVSLMIADIETVSKGVSAGIEVCVHSIIPSLLIFFIMSDIIIKLSSWRKVSPKWIAFFLGSFCGFPVGTNVCLQLNSQGIISDKDTGKLLKVCNNTGAAYVIGAIGVSMLGDKRLGLLLYSSEIISSFIFLLPIRCRHESICNETKIGNFTEVFFNSIEKAVFTVLKVSTIICFFSGVIALISKYANKTLVVVLTIILEISNGAAYCVAWLNESPELLIALLAFLCSWAGVCVHLQVFSLLKSIKVKYLPFAFSKFLQGLLSSIVAFAGYKLFFST